MQWWQCPIHNGTLETFILSKMWKKLSVLWLEKSLFLWVFPLLFINKKCASPICRKTSNENDKFKEIFFISDSQLIRQNFKGNQCKSGISIFICIYQGSREITLTVPLISKKNCSNGVFSAGVDCRCMQQRQIRQTTEFNTVKKKDAIFLLLKDGCNTGSRSTF